MKKPSQIILLSTLSILSSCASLNSVSISPIPAQRKQIVHAASERIIFFGLNFDNDFVDNLSNSLKRKCRNGLIQGILTKDEVITYFPRIVEKRKISASGYCQKS